MDHAGAGHPWVELEAKAAIPLKAPLPSGYRLTKSLTPVAASPSGRFTRGNLVRVRLTIEADRDMTWVVVNDPIPAGASHLGTGLSRDSHLALQTEEPKARMRPTFEERAFDGFRAYYEFLPIAIFSDGVEPERQEWFLQGTEPPPLATRPAVGLSRVRTPAVGEVIGLDPDIPAAHQRVLFAADGTGSGHRWVLNGQDLGPVVGPLLWKPVPGEYRLSLVGPDGRALDMVSFEVRPGVTTVGAAPSRQR